MRELTNMAWPNEPFGAARRPFGVPGRLLAAVGLTWSESHEWPPTPVQAATVYLRLHRTRSIELDQSTFDFGFRLVAADGDADTRRLLTVIDHDQARAYRHAAVLAAHRFGPDLTALIAAAGAGRQLPGVVGLAMAWQGRANHSSGTAKMFDTGHDLPEDFNPGLDDACRAWNIDPHPVDLTNLHGDETDATLTITRAFAAALITAGAMRRYHWKGRLPLHQLVNQTTWDQFTSAPR